MNSLTGQKKLSEFQLAELKKLRSFAIREFQEDILPFWEKYAPDHMQGGFIGRVDSGNNQDHSASKGLVLNARILWTFSSAAQFFEDPVIKELADKAWQYVQKFFRDNQYGGYFWTVSPKGQPEQTKKQVYAQAFVIYALSEYYKIHPEDQILEEAIQLYQTIEKYALDTSRNGYLEAFSKEWGPLEDIRLSHLDMNEKKSMNTHLHIVEGYVNLFRIWPDPVLAERIRNLLNIFLKWIIDFEDSHLRLFFDENWLSKSDSISYGHDIEAGWLLFEAAEALGDDKLIGQIGDLSVRMAKGVLPGINAMGGLCHETERSHPGNIGETEWWAQAEAIVGLLNAWEISHSPEFLKTAMGIMDYIQNYFLDLNGGEWFYRLNPEGEPILTYDKLGMWKCPYHTSRMCFELIRRSEKYLSL